MRRLVIRIIQCVVTFIVLLFGTESIARVVVRRIRNKIYSLWICSHIKCDEVRFEPCVNAIRGVEHIKIGRNTRFGKEAVITAWDEHGGEMFFPSITIGERCCFGDYVHITSIYNIKIGDNVLMGRWVTITDNGHGTTDIESMVVPPLKRTLYSKGAVIIEDDVWIGDKATILAGVTIGKGTVVAANSVVTKNIPAYSVAAGVPAKVIKRCIGMASELTSE